MSLSKYLVARGKRGTFQLRVQVPTEYRRRHGGPVERIKSMKTSDRDLAARRALPVLAGWQAEWGSGEQENEPTVHAAPPDVASIAVEVGYDTLLTALEERRAAWSNDAEEYDQQVTQRRIDHRRMAAEYLRGDRRRFEAIADRSIAARRLPLSRGTQEYDNFVEAMAKAALDALDVHNRRSGGELEAAPRSSVVNAVKQARGRKAKQGESLLELYDHYAQWRCQPGRKRRRRAESFVQDRVAVELFAEFVGHDRAVGSITKDEAKAFRAMLPKFPAGRGKSARLASMPIAKCIEAASVEQLRTLSLTTQAKYLSILSPFFAWLVSDSPVGIPENIFVGLNHKLERGENRRPSYTSEQLKTLAASPLFNSCSGRGREHIEGDEKVRDWRYWIPLLCMLTGSRITEVAQLRVDDVDVRDGVPLILLTHDEKRGQFVKNKRKRLAALHPGFFAGGGFSDFWDRQKQRAEVDGNPQLFPELKPDSRGLLGSTPSKWFRRYLERVDIKTPGERDGLGSHAFRHTLSDALRNAGFLDLEFGQLVMGHSNNTITAAYGAVPQGTPARLQEMVVAAFEAEPYASAQISDLWDRGNAGSRNDDK